MLETLTTQQNGADVCLNDGMPVDISRHQHLIEDALEGLQGSHLSFPRQLAMAAASVQEALALLPDLADAVLVLLPDDTDSDQARAVLRGMKPFLNNLTNSGTELAGLALLAVARGLPTQGKAIGNDRVPEGGPVTSRGKP